MTRHTAFHPRRIYWLSHYTLSAPFFGKLLFHLQAAIYLKHTVRSGWSGTRTMFMWLTRKTNVNGWLLVAMWMQRDYTLETKHIVKRGCWGRYLYCRCSFLQSSHSVLKNIMFTSQILATLSSVSDFLIVISSNSSFLSECIRLCPVIQATSLFIGTFLLGDIEANTATLDNCHNLIQVFAMMSLFGGWLRLSFLYHSMTFIIKLLVWTSEVEDLKSEFKES